MNAKRRGCSGPRTTLCCGPSIAAQPHKLAARTRRQRGGTIVRHNNTVIYALTSTCPQCHGLLRLRHRRDGQGAFLGCSAFPACRFTAEYEPVLADLAARLEAAEAHVPALSADSLDRA